MPLTANIADRWRQKQQAAGEADGQYADFLHVQLAREGLRGHADDVGGVAFDAIVGNARDWAVITKKPLAATARAEATMQVCVGFRGLCMP